MRIPLKAVRASNEYNESTFPTGLVAVFIGATAGIGEYTLLEFVKHVPKSRIYFVGRSEADGLRVKTKCDALNPHGSCTFIPADISLMKNVDEVCRMISEREEKINLLFMTQGTLNLSDVTPEGIRTILALMVYSRIRFMLNLLPQLQAAGSQNFARVVSVASGTYEGRLDLEDLDKEKIPRTQLLKAHGHLMSMITLTMDHVAQQAPTVSFIHGHPGPVYTKIDRTFTGWQFFLKWLIRFLMLFKSLSASESGARHVFLATSSLWPARDFVNSGVQLPALSAKKVAVGIDGKPGSGMYSVNEWGDSAGKRATRLLKGYQADGTRDKLWEHVERKLVAITGQKSMNV